jgi:IS30 family transposase
LGYLPDRADACAAKLMRRNLKIFRSNKLCQHVISKLKLGWSPEQIAGRLKLEDRGFSVSHETIYKFVYSQEGQQQGLPLLLSRRKLKRTTKYGRKPRQSHIPDTASISQRPKVIEKRKRIGHWEGDLVVFSSLRSANVTTLVERKSRYIKLVHNHNKYTKSVISGIQNALKDIPAQYRKTITFDRGTEFASYRQLGITTYFCNPHSPWQKGSNENFNGRLRRYLPKSYNHHNLSQTLLDQISEKMNNQPRKCLGYNTPAEIFRKTKPTLVALDP